MRKNIFIVALVIIVLILFRYVYSLGLSALKSKSIAKRPLPEVVVQDVEEQEVIQTYEIPGRVNSKFQVSVLARISGYLQKSYFKEGDFVKTGDILFLIEPMEYQNASNVASANVKNIEAQLEYANKQLVRAGELVKDNYISKSRYDEILANRNALVARVQSAKTSYKDSQRNLNYTKVKSPIDGRIGFIDVSVGNYVSPTSGSLTSINSTNPIYVKFPMQSKDYIDLSIIDKNNNQGRRVELFFQNGTKYEYEGTQDFLDNKVDETTGTVTMRATFKNPDNTLLHGEYVNIKLYANNKIKKPVVPVVAVQENQEGKYVYKIDSEGLPQLTYIKVQGQDKNNWIVQEGLRSTDRIIVDGLIKVTPGKLVKIVEKVAQKS